MESLKVEFLVLIILSIIANIFFIFIFHKLANKLNFLDNVVRVKIHKKATPNIGGFIFFICFIFYAIFFTLNYNFLSIREIFIIIFSGFSIFLLGLYDDKYNINYQIKAGLLIFFCYLIFNISSKFIIDQLNFSFNYNIYLGTYSVIFSTICIFTLINMFNLFDGVNGQSGIFLLIIISYLGYKTGIIIFIPLIISIFFFLFLNLNNKIFLGNNGSYFTSYLLSLILIYYYKYSNLFFADEILLLLFFPFIDMIRLFFLRMLKGLSPFEGDNNHLHHMVLFKYNKVLYVNINSIIQIILPLLIYNMFNKILLAFIVSILLYFFSFFFLRK